LGWGGIGPGVGEVDRAIGLDHHVIGTVEPSPLEAVGEHGEAAVEFPPGHSPGVMLTGHKAALEVAGEPISAVGRLLVHGDAFAGRVFHAPVVMNITKEKVPAFLPPDGAFGGAEFTAKARGQLLDGLGRGEDLVQLRSKLLDLLWRLGPYAT